MLTTVLQEISFTAHAGFAALQVFGFTELVRSLGKLFNMGFCTLLLACCVCNMALSLPSSAVLKVICLTPRHPTGELVGEKGNRQLLAVVLPRLALYQNPPASLVPELIRTAQSSEDRCGCISATSDMTGKTLDEDVRKSRCKSQRSSQPYETPGCAINCFTSQG